MISVKTGRELEAMRLAGKISARALRLAGTMVEPGVSTFEIDKAIRKYIESEGATPNFLGYAGFPASACISVNNVVIHGIPDHKTILKAGDIVSVDVGAFIGGYNGDNAYTFACGDVSEKAKNLLKATEESLYKGIAQAKAGNRIGDIGYAVQTYAEARSYSVVRDFVGHGVGAKLHEDPEPMVNAGTYQVKTLQDGWTTVTADGDLSAHFEHTVAITPSGPVILTLPD